MNSVQLDIIGPLAPIVGALIGTVLTALVAYFILMKRKKVAFWVTVSESITLPLLANKIVFSIDGKTIANLNRGAVRVENSGNMCIAQFAFELEILGEHQVCIAEIGTSDGKLRTSAKLEQELGLYGAVVKVSLDFFNPKEEFQVLTYFDGATVNLKVNYRMEEVRFKVQQCAY